MKPSLFIGSSGKSLFIAKEIEKLLQKNFDVKVWDSVMRPQEFFLETLSRELYLTDFGLFVIFPDDEIEQKGSRGYTTRDNVIFELGMFVGVLGIKRAYFLVIDVVKNGVKMEVLIPSDLDGIKKTRMRLEITEEYALIENSANRSSIDKACEIISANILDVHEGIMLSLLPSTSLAIGYFKNFILQACLELSQTDDFELDGNHYDMTSDAFEFYIMMPMGGSKSSHEAYRKFVRKNKLKQIEIKSTKSPRTFPFFISSEVKEGKIQLYDLPTTLRASSDTIKLVLPIQTPAREIEQLEKKEIINFRRTLEYLLKEPEAIDFQENIHIVDIREVI